MTKIVVDGKDHGFSKIGETKSGSPLCCAQSFARWCEDMPIRQSLAQHAGEDTFIVWIYPGKILTTPEYADVVRELIKPA